MLDKAGVVGPKSATFQKLSDLLPAEYKGTMILPGGTTVYFPGAAKDATDSATALRTNLQLDQKFRLKAGDFVDELYAETKLVGKAPPGTGTRRDFAKQMTVISAAGPGESNHQFGQAADVGLAGLKWVDGDGTVRTDNAWLDSGDAGGKAFMTPEKAKEFWKAHHAAFAAKGLHPTLLKGDEVHVQAYKDTDLSYSKSLTNLLNATGAMKWGGAKGGNGPNKYASDLGLGGKQFAIGTAKNIYGGEGKIEKADVVEALKASGKDLSKLDVYKDFQFVKDALKDVKGAPGKPLQPVTAAKVTEKDITDADLERLRQAAKADWVKADQNWKAWTPTK